MFLFLQAETEDSVDITSLIEASNYLKWEFLWI